jgi:hypothetical protein
MSATITVVGTVEFSFRNDDSTKFIVSVDDGGKWPTRLTVFQDGFPDLQKGDTVTVTSERLPYAKSRTYTDKEGNEKTANDLILPGATISGGSAAPVLDDDSIPF